MSFDTDFVTARGIVDQVYFRALRIAREYGLSISANRQLRHPSLVAINPWVSVLKMEGTESEYRIGFDVHLSEKFNKPGTARVWTLVTDLRTNTHLQFVRDDVPLSDLEETIREALEVFETHLKSNDGLDPIVMAKYRLGTRYYWLLTHDRGCSSCSTDFDGSDWCGEIQIEEDDDEYRGSLTKISGKEKPVEFRDKDRESLISTIEDYYDRHCLQVRDLIRPEV